MRKVFFLVLGFFLLSLGAVRALESGVGALADRLSTAGSVVLSGKTAPWAEVVVVDPEADDQVMAVAELDVSGEFRFTFRIGSLRLNRLQIFAVDTVGTTNRILVADQLGGEVVLPPTIVNDESDDGVNNLAWTGFTYPGSEVEIFLDNDNDYNNSFLVEADSNGKWVLNEDGLPAGEYVGTARSSFGGIDSELSQEIYFQISQLTVPKVVVDVVDTLLDLLPTEVGDLIRERPDQVSRVLAPVATLPVFGFLLRDLLALLFRFGLGLLRLFGWRRERKSWGVVYDAVTKEPISRAIVRLYLATEKRLVETDVTGAEGVFAFLPQAGKYFVSVVKAGYKFPSKLVKGSGNDGEYGYVYHGEEFEVEGADEEIRLSIPVDANEAKIEKYWWFYTKRFLVWLWKFLGWVLLVFGLGISLAALVREVSLVNVGVVGFYLGLLLWEGRDRLVVQRRWSVVKDVDTGNPVPNVSLALYEVEFNRLVQRRVSNEQGRILLVVPPGRYKLEVAAVDWEADFKTSKKGYKGEELEIKGNKTKAIKVTVWVKRK